MITIKDIAKIVGVSYSTVSRALNDLPGTNPETKRKVLAVANELGYQPNAIARSLVTNKSSTLAMVVPDLTNPYFTTILQAAEREAEESGYQFLICETMWRRDKEKKELKVLYEKRVDGIIIYPANSLSEEPIDNFQIPAVIIGHSTHPANNCSGFVEANNRSGARLVVEHMLDCGYHRLAFAGGPVDSGSSKVRRQGFIATLQMYGHEADPDLISAGDYTLEAGYRHGKKLFALPESKRPDGVVCANDLIALGMLQAASESGIKVPEQLGIIGFDDVEYAALPQIRLSTIRIPCDEMGRMAFKLLLNNLMPADEKSGLSLPPGSRITLEPKLIARDTTNWRRKADFYSIRCPSEEVMVADSSGESEYSVKSNKKTDKRK